MSSRKNIAVAGLMSAAMMTMLAGCGLSATQAKSSPVPSISHQPKIQTVTVKKPPRHVPTYAMELVPSHLSASQVSDVNLKKDIYYTNRVVVISFHDMSLHLNSKFNMSPTVFAQDLQSLHQYHFNAITNQQFVGWMQHRNTIPANAVLLTFDDGYKSMYTHALPILLRNHMTGTFFIITHGQDAGPTGFMTWPEVQAMAKAGMAIESHTYNLHYLVDVHGHLTAAFNTAYYQGKWQTPTQYFERDYHDFLTARLQIEQHLGHPVNEIAWPYGYGNLVAYDAARAAGYSYFFTTASGYNTAKTSSWYIRRVDVGLYPNPQEVINKILTTAGSPAELVPQAPQKSNPVNVHST
ncbi:polysaccharide deacetylase family protein [Alicyclobacillus ferrooxydans]|uniref:NodB homology domain-containing protein n=1 Tax=Alicyclobacillus ferrooxydans TaxID=471514 RepID=A0A0P9D0S3_9BACL|nr:polysaccharide deacetylase family protein [Alicyclobacillus ferrooxydans]KPV43092.1 hypothetical protein AN477_14255 [Alicyclobacillus ferrooxydans]